MHGSGPQIEDEIIEDELGKDELGKDELGEDEDEDEEEEEDEDESSGQLGITTQRLSTSCPRVILSPAEISLH